MAKEKKPKKNSGKNTGFLLAPMYFFTIVFVGLPFVYLFLLSFLQRAEVWGVDFTFTLENYKRIFNPMYLGNFADSFKLAFTSTICIVLLGYPYGYIMGRMNQKWKKRMLLLILIPFFTSALIRLYGWIIVFRSNGVLDKILMGLDITSKPLKLLYTYPAVVVGMIYALMPFMILAVYSSAEKLDYSLVEAARDLGADSFKTFTRIILPLSLPGVISGITMVFVPALTTFVISTLLGGSKILLIGNVIEQEFTVTNNWHLGSGLSIVLMIFIIINMIVTSIFDKDGEGAVL